MSTVPNYRSPDIPMLVRFRQRCIRLLAGRMVVVLNARLSMRPALGKSVHVSNCPNGLLLHGCGIPAPDVNDRVLHVESEVLYRA